MPAKHCIRRKQLHVGIGQGLAPLVGNRPANDEPRLHDKNGLHRPQVGQLCRHCGVVELPLDVFVMAQGDRQPVNARRQAAASPTPLPIGPLLVPADVCPHAAFSVVAGERQRYTRQAIGRLEGSRTTPPIGRLFSSLKVNSGGIGS